ncbi:MAG: hypothetical protein IKH19_09570 [Muribaculaceae bacterium]|nr:hypothetical protein [Muribaculaceae bacterium]
MYDISEILQELLDRYSNTSQLDREFNRMLQEDEDMQEDYREWCDVHGYSTTSGYRDYIDEFVESQDSIWDNYKEFGNDI